jgi:uncharacterized protein (DUF2062 family)
MGKKVKENRWKRRLNYLFHRMFPKRQSRHKVDLSVFLGVFIGLLPTLGIALILTYAAAKIFRVPPGPGLASSFIAIPPTLFLFFYPSGYAVGRWILNPPQSAGVDILKQMEEMTMSNAFEKISFMWHDAKLHFLSFMIGIFFVALAFATLSYFLSLVVMHFRHKNWQIEKERRLLKRKHDKKHNVVQEL